MHPALRLVSERLPNVRDRAAQLFERDPTFRELCDEYQICNETAVRMMSAAETSEAFRNEYLALRLRLEAELLRYLSEHRDQ
jgi:hypothetical protein